MDYKMVNNQPNELKYFCKVCNKGFGCGRALGGHMRSHGIGGEERSGIVFDDDDDDDDDPTADDWDDDKMGVDYNVQPENRRMYALRKNPNRMKSCRVCKNCGEEFMSWKLFLEHGKCTSDGVEPFAAQTSEGEEDVERRSSVGWSKRKRSLRVTVDECSTNCLSSEEEELANCLMMLSNTPTTTSTRLRDEPEESCASASREDHERRNTSNYLPLITYETHFDKAKGVGRGLFECKACKKVFTSHQALGGHRASHKKVKGCFASHLDHEDLDQNVNQNATQVIDHFIPREDFLMPQAKSKSTLQFERKLQTQLMLSKKKSKVHECSICHRVFQSGQALGGHKRCHWITSNHTHDTSTSLGKFPHYQDHQIEHNASQIPTLTKSEQLDLNKLPTTTTITVNEFGKVSRDPQNPLSFEVSTEIVLYDKNEHHLQQTSHTNDANKAIIIYNDDDAFMQTRDDELEAKVELSKLSELKDMGSDSSPWLQVGIGSTSINFGGNT